MDRSIRVAICIVWDCVKGEQYRKYSIDDNMVEKIIYHEPNGSGDSHYIDVIYTDGIIREFNLVSIGIDKEYEE